MKSSIFLIVVFLFSISSLFIPKTVHAQEDMDFEEFMGMMSVTLSDDQLDELSYQLPWDITVTAYGYGDFSGHGLNDFVIAVKEKGVTPQGTVDVYFLENIGDSTFEVVDQKNYKYFDLTIEVAFLVKDGECFVTNRDKMNWYFTGYQIDPTDSLVMVDKEVYPIENKEKAGE